jgi:hypothetical protein
MYEAALDAAAIDNGGTDNGAPNVRPECSGRRYDAAFALDPDGNNVEVSSTHPCRPRDSPSDDIPEHWRMKARCRATGRQRAE